MDKTVKVILSPLERYGKEYKRILQCRKRYLVIKGSRGSKKSRNISQKWIDLLAEFPLSNLVVIRKFYTLHKDSTFATLMWAIKQAGMENLWRAKISPLEIVNKVTKQKIIFRGIDDPEGISSLTVSNGVLNFMWIEEGFQLEKEVQFDMCDDIIRGALPPGYFAHIIITFNPWNENHWLRRRFFIKKDDDVTNDTRVRYVEGWQIETQDTLAITVDYRCNEWLTEFDLQRFERMKVNQPGRYRVAGLGDWGITGNLVYDNWEIQEFDPNNMLSLKRNDGRPYFEHRIGLDPGYSKHLAVVGILVDNDNSRIYIYDEIYESRLKTKEMVLAIKAKGWAKEPIHTDSENPQLIADLEDTGLSRIFGVSKPKDSVTSGIQKIRGYRIIVHPKCENFITEISNYSFKEDKGGKELPQPRKEFDHLMDALRYAMTDKQTGGTIFVSDDINIKKQDERNKILKAFRYNNI